MKILYLPFNVASMQAITSDAVNKLRGVDAISYSVGKHKYQTAAQNSIEIVECSKRELFKYLKAEFKKYYHFFRLLLWADVVHYMWDSFLPFDLDLRMVKLLKKPCVIEWVGSDIRNPSKAFLMNPYLKEVFYKGYEYASIEDDEKSDRIQRKFKKYGFEPVAGPELALYINKSYFSNIHTIFQRINVNDFAPCYPDSTNKRPLIIHSPTAKVAKGSTIIIPIIKELQKEYEFDFMLLHNLSRSEVLEALKKADIFLDQIIIGVYGLAACEAMSYGKPVMCYMMPDVYREGFPPECPVVNTNPDNLREQLIKLITNPQLRNDLGKKSRAFAEKYHHVDKVAVQLVEIYKGVIDRRRKN